MNMRHYLNAALAVLWVLVAAPSAQAHHSFSAIFDVSTVITLKGVISKIDWINPHVYIDLDLKDSSGKVTTWGVESPPTNHLRAAGISRRNRRIQKSRSEMRPVFSHSRSSRRVIRKPESVKKSDMPR